MIMETKYTPGEWFQSHRKIPNDPDGMYSTQVYTKDGREICSLAWYPKPKVETIMFDRAVLLTETYRDANAKLISAAPNLLEALDELYRAIVKSGDDINISTITKDKVKSAIKKATE